MYIDGEEGGNGDVMQFFEMKEIRFTREEIQMINNAVYMMDLKHEEGTKEHTICETITDKIAVMLFGQNSHRPTDRRPIDKK